MELFFSPTAWLALLTLTFLEIVLGVDNIIFISIVSNKLPAYQRKKARNIGLSLALLFRLFLLMSIYYIVRFTEPLFYIFEHPFSIRDCILFVGGIFLIFKSTIEVHHKMETFQNDENHTRKEALLITVIIQIILLDIIFSFDSILTAIGLTDELILMVLAVVISMIIMMLFSGKISDFISRHPSLEILALSFLILIGFMLIVDAFGHHVPKGYIYFAVFFSLVVELLNIKMKKKTKPIKLNKRF